MPFNPNGYRGVKQLTPKNYGSKHRAQQRLDHVVNRANTQLEEALYVDGIPLQHWQRTERGEFCTCQNLSKEKAQNDVNIEDTFDQAVEPANKTDTFTIRQKRNKLYPQNQGGDNGSLQKLNDFVESVSLNSGLDPLAEELALLSQGDMSGFNYGGERTRCGICFGTGYTEGYCLSSGQRIVLDASGSHEHSFKGFFVNRNNYPYTFEAEFDETHFVEWRVELPAYFMKCYQISVRNNTVRAANVKVLIKLLNEASDWVEMTPTVIDTLRGCNNLVALRAVPERSSLEEATCQLTHIEIVFQTALWPLMQMPSLSETYNPEASDKLQTSTFIVSPRLALIQREDIIYESKYGKLWMVTAVTDGVTSKRQTFAWNVEVRSLVEAEQRSLLKLLLDPKLNLSYAGQEQYQGLDTYGQPYHGQG